MLPNGCVFSGASILSRRILKLPLSILSKTVMVSPSVTATTLPLISAEKSERESKSREHKNRCFTMAIPFGVMGNTAKKEVHPRLYNPNRLPQRTDRYNARMHRVCRCNTAQKNYLSVRLISIVVILGVKAFYAIYKFFSSSVFQFVFFLPSQLVEIQYSKYSTPMMKFQLERAIFP